MQWKKDRKRRVQEERGKEKGLQSGSLYGRVRGWERGGASTKCQGKRGVSGNRVTVAGWAKDEQRAPQRSSLGEMGGKPMEPGILEAGEAGSFRWKHLGNCWRFLFIWVGGRGWVVLA